MNNIDSIFDELRQIAPDPRLEQMDDAVMARANMRRSQNGVRNRLGVTFSLALCAGVFAGVVSQPAPTGRELAFNALPSNAPSYLLVGVR